jgi:hypothetical protein
LKRERKKNKKETKQKVGVRRRVGLLHLFSVFFFTLRAGHGYAFCPARRTSSKEEKRERDRDKEPERGLFIFGSVKICLAGVASWPYRKRHLL